jgi:hypothetical protein
MLRNRLFWTGLLMPGSAAAWVFVIAGFFLPLDGVVKIIWLVMLPVWTIVHPLEIITSYKIGKEKNLSFARTAVMTILFGFTWWLPLKMGVIDK